VDDFWFRWGCSIFWWIFPLFWNLFFSLLINSNQQKSFISLKFPAIFEKSLFLFVFIHVFDKIWKPNQY
jgi:uncharacterized membrane protein (DUF373 family)